VPVAYRTSIGDFVRHEGEAHYARYRLFRPDHGQVLAELRALEEAGEEIDYSAWWPRITRIGELMLAVDEDGFTADLYLDRELVQEEEVEALIDGTLAFLEDVPMGASGGAFGVCWMQEIADYSVNPT
jgi:hypothetical protein